MRDEVLSQIPIFKDVYLLAIFSQGFCRLQRSYESLLLVICELVLKVNHLLVFVHCNAELLPVVVHLRCLLRGILIRLVEDAFLCTIEGQEVFSNFYPF